jgi:hypothetical protein
VTEPNLPDLPVDREMLNTALEQMRRGEGVEVDVHQLRSQAFEQVHRESRRPLPANAYIRPGLGDLPLSAQLRAAFRLITETLLPLIDSVEAQQPQVVQCTVCYRNLGGWPEQVLVDHYFQHSWLQRRLAKVGIR